MCSGPEAGWKCTIPKPRIRWCFHGVVGVALFVRYVEMAHRAIVGKICPDANFEGVDGGPGCTLRSLGDGKRTIVLEWYGHH